MEQLKEEKILTIYCVDRTKIPTRREVIKKQSTLNDCTMN
jgi:hypothetical protein